MHANFLLGTLIYEESVEAAIGRNPLDLIARHAVCDHGIVSRRQKVRNRVALDEHDEIVSEYHLNPLHPEDGSIRFTTSAGWGETVVSIIPPPPPRGDST